MANESAITDILTLGGRLKTTLEEEFITLSEKNLERLEEVQVRKIELLRELDETWNNAQLSEDDAINFEDPLWDEARALVNECKEAHIRNDLLLKRQLEVVRTVLSSLTKRSADNQSNLYDKRGRMRRR